MSAKETELECGHETDYTPPPLKGDIVYCRKCVGYRLVKVKQLERKYIFTCIECDIEKAYGTYSAGIVVKRQHNYRNPEHVTKLVVPNERESDLTSLRRNN